MKKIIKTGKKRVFVKSATFDERFEDFTLSLITIDLSGKEGTPYGDKERPIVVMDRIFEYLYFEDLADVVKCLEKLIEKNKDRVVAIGKLVEKEYEAKTKTISREAKHRVSTYLEETLDLERRHDRYMITVVIIEGIVKVAAKDKLFKEKFMEDLGSQPK